MYERTKESPYTYIKLVKSGKTTESKIKNLPK